MLKKSQSIFAAMAAVGAISTPDAIWEDVAAKTQRPSRTSQMSRSYRGLGNGRRYPEQSSRQSMRLHRRAQGGNGLVFTGTGYEPKTKFDDLLPR